MVTTSKREVLCTRQMRCRCWKVLLEVEVVVVILVVSNLAPQVIGAIAASRRRVECCHHLFDAAQCQRLSLLSMH
jgi:hypothetical protein